jgi:D-alanyl-lipoteichoic acid acyltransferase DltB (MBOAT superfamily)
MSFVVWAVAIAIAVVLFIFTGVWGGLIWILVAGAVLLAFGLVGSNQRLRRSRTEPTGTTRSQTGSGTANKRVGQS